MKTGQWYHGGMARPVTLDTEKKKSPTSSDPSHHHHKSRFPSQQPTNEDGQKITTSAITNTTSNTTTSNTPLKRQFSITSTQKSGAGKGPGPPSVEEQHASLSRRGEYGSLVGAERGGIGPTSGEIASRGQTAGEIASRGQTADVRPSKRVVHPADQIPQRRSKANDSPTVSINI